MRFFADRDRTVSPRCLRFYEVAYAAFELGRWTLAAADPGLEPAERARRTGQAQRLADALRRRAAREVLGPELRLNEGDRPG